eukprot:342018_1
MSRSLSQLCQACGTREYDLLKEKCESCGKSNYTRLPYGFWSHKKDNGESYTDELARLINDGTLLVNADLAVHFQQYWHGFTKDNIRTIRNKTVSNNIANLITRTEWPCPRMMPDGTKCPHDNYKSSQGLTRHLTADHDGFVTCVLRAANIQKIKKKTKKEKYKKNKKKNLDD